MRVFQANILLARLAVDAGDMRIGPSIWLMGMTNPVQTANEAATIDWIAPGGYTLALGLGYWDQEFQAFGETACTRAARTTEAIEVIRKLWSQERVTHHGRFFNIHVVGPRSVRGTATHYRYGWVQPWTLKFNVRLG